MRRFLPTIAAVLVTVSALAAVDLVILDIKSHSISVLTEQGMDATDLANAYPHTGTLPETVDLTKWAPKAATQGPNGSCAAWAVGYTILGWYANKAGTPTVFAPMYVYSQTHLKNTKDGGGSTTASTYDLITEQGIAPLNVYTQGNDNFTTKPTSAEKKAAAKYKVASWTELYSAPAGDAGTEAETAIKTVLASGNPVGLSIPVTEKFQYLDKTHHDWDLKSSNAGKPETNLHYVAILGYDKTGVWIENSWSTQWGLNGFAHLSWDFINRKSLEAEAIHGFVKN